MMIEVANLVGEWRNAGRPIAGAEQVLRRIQAVIAPALAVASREGRDVDDSFEGRISEQLFLWGAHKLHAAQAMHSIEVIAEEATQDLLAMLDVLKASNERVYAKLSDMEKHLKNTSATLQTLATLHTIDKVGPAP